MSDMKREDASAPVDAADTQAVAATPETPATPETGTPSFADACERAALAVQDMRERDQAMETLLMPAATTAVLTEATRSGGTQEMPASLRVAAQQAATTPTEASEDAVPSEAPRFPRRRVLIVAGAAVALVLIGLAAWWGISSLTRVDATVVAQVLEADSAFMDGFASDDYVEPSPYALEDVQVVSVQTDDDGSSLADVTARLENESFSSEVSATVKLARSSERARYSELKNAPATDSGWSGAVIASSATTRAIAGVTVDDEFPDGFDPTFDAAAQTCTYTAERTFDLWFAASTVSTPYTYTFDGTAWARSEGASERTVTYDAAALEGAYAPGDGDTGALTDVTLLGFDEQSGTFAIEYRASTPGFGTASVSGTLQCTLAPAEPTDDAAAYRQVDGQSYTFAGEGTSTGGAGTASITGVVGLDGNLVVSLSIDYTEEPFLFGSPSDETMTVAGVLVRVQE